MLASRILFSLSREPQAPDYAGGTINTNFDNALQFLCRTVPAFLELIKGMEVLDYGCGWGWQALAMASKGAKRVVGLDIQELDSARLRAEEYGCADRVRFVNQLEPEMMGAFDVIVSCSSFEHLSDPEGCLRQMSAAAKPGGKVIVAFAEPWYSPYGSHMNFFTKIPWVNLLFSETTVMAVRSHFRKDGARRYEDVEGGLNRMTLATFENIIRRSGMKVEFLKYYSVKSIPLVEKVPLLRELLVASVACILQNSGWGETREYSAGLRLNNTHETDYGESRGSPSTQYAFFCSRRITRSFEALGHQLCGGG
jgi:SAM-dependent methyltransferase